MGLRLIRNHDIVYTPVTGLGAPLFPDFGKTSREVDVDETQDIHEMGTELLQQAYREGYASGYALSWAIQRRRTIPLLRTLDRVGGDFEKCVRRDRRGFERRLHEIANVVAASLVANEQDG